jgi:hypothetical protein
LRLPLATADRTVWHDLDGAGKEASWSGGPGRSGTAEEEVRVLATLMIEYRLPTSEVPGFADWKQVFDTDPVGRKAHGATRHWIHRDPDDPDHFILGIEFPSVAEADGFLNEPMLRGSWDVSGAGKAWVLEEAEAVTY